MQFKPDWEEAKQRILEFWHKENQARCLLQVRARRPEVSGRRITEWPGGGQELQEAWLDPQNIISRHECYFENTYFAAEAVPCISVNLGPSSLASYLGSPVHFAKHTAWFEPVIENWNNYEIEFNENNQYWQKTEEITSEASKAGKGRFMAGIADLGGSGDVVAHMRGSERLCFDLLDSPAIIRDAESIITDILLQCIHRLQNITSNCQEGCIDWLGLWAPDTYKTLQCDFSAMVSPAMFSDFFLPELQRQAAAIPYSFYHLDGPDAVKHLELLLEVDEINGIQWIPGAGQPSAVGWIPMLKRIQEKGKCLYLYASPEEAVILLNDLSYKGLCINIESDFESSREADEFIIKVEKLCRHNGQ